MKVKTVLAQAIVVPILAGAISGCGHGPFAVVDSSSQQLYHPDSSRSVPGSPADRYRLENLKLDTAYQRLSTHMDLAAELALSSEQTLWLNERVNACMLTGVLDYECATRLTLERVAVLNARPLPASPIASKGAALPAVLPATIHPEAPQIPSQAATPTLIVARAAPVQPALKVVPPAASKAAVGGRIYAVAVTAMPWIWHTGGVNQDFSFGYPNGTPPTRVPLAADGAAPGDLVTIKYTGGRIAIGAGGPSADGDGFAGVYSDGSRSQLGAFPSSYMHPYPINLGALVGAFTDANGAIVGQPFAVNGGTVQLPMPAGAAQLQLGINDDNFGGTTEDTRNSGGFKVSVAVVKGSASP